MKEFKSLETKEKLLKWVNTHCESWGGYERECFNDFVFTLIKNKEFLTKIELAEFIIDNKSWRDQEFIDRFLEETTDKIAELQDFIEFLLESNRIKIL